MLETELAGLKLRNPLILASGILGDTGPSLKRVYSAGAGAVTTKSVSLNKREGNPTPIIVEYERGLLNCVGLSSQPAGEMVNELKGLDFPLVVSVQGKSNQDFVSVIKKLEQAAGIFELNVSCPNVEGKMLGTDAAAVAGLVKAAKKATKKPVFVKLSPNVTDVVKIAKSAEKAGADGLTAINSVGPGMVIDVDLKKPVLSFKRGGVSGPAIRPIAVRIVYDLYESVKVPVIGLGGVSSWKDAVEMVLAGATGVGIGTAILHKGPEVFREVEKGMRNYLVNNNYKSLNEIRGLAHK